MSLDVTKTQEQYILVEINFTKFVENGKYSKN